MPDFSTAATRTRKGVGDSSRLASVQNAPATNTSNATISKNSAAGPRRRPLTERNKNLQTPARTGSVARRTEQATATGKLTSRRQVMMAQTPVSRPVASQQGTKQNAAETFSDNSDEMDLYEDDKAAGEQSINAIGVPGMLKRPKWLFKASTAPLRKSAYDVPDSSKVDDSRQAKNAQGQEATSSKRQGAAARLAAKRAKLMSNRQRSPAPTAPTRAFEQSKGKAREPDPQSASSNKSTRRQPARKVKTTLGGPHAQDQEKSARSGVDALGTARALSEGPKSSDTAPHPHGVAEGHLVPVLDQDTEELSRSPHIKTHHIKTEPVDQGHLAVPSTAAAKQNLGASQDYAITLSDRHSSSSLSSVLSQSPHGISAPVVVNEGATASTHRVPQTPAMFKSSPPVKPSKYNETPNGGTGGTSRKANIISFDELGPRNQGSLSAKTVRASLPSKSALLVSEAGTNRGELDIRSNNRPRSTATNVSTARSSGVAAVGNIAGNVDEALAGFFTKSKPRGPVSEYLPRNKPAFAASQSRQAEAESTLEEGYANIDDLEGTTLAQDELQSEQPRPTASQLAMPPPGTNITKNSADCHASLVPKMLPASTNAAITIAEDGVQTIDKAHKKRRATDEEEENEKGRKRAKSGMEDRGEERAGAIVGPLNARQSSADAVGQLSKRKSGKPSRQVSQGNVDRHGSPMPRGLLVAGDASALETFRQRTKLSCDHKLAEVDNVDSDEHGNKRSVDAQIVNQHNLLPSHQLEVMSSNAKTRPASPRDESQAITEMAIGRVDPETLIIRDAAAHPATDPFTSSGNVRKDCAKAGASFKFAEKFRKHGAADAEGANAYASGKFDDREKTLVASEGQEQRPLKRMMRFSSDASNASISSGKTNNAVGDTGHRRDALPPYRMKLFDELVAVSHRLMRNLVDRETAARDVVDDYQRRGMSLVQQMEKAHAAQHKQYVQELQQKKKRLKKDLAECNEQLKDAALGRGVQEANEEGNERTEGRGREEDELRKLMTDFC